MPAGPIIGTSQVTLQLTGTSSVPNNFTIDIYSWDVPTDTAIFNRTYATGVSRTTTSVINGGSLTVSPYYEVTGITGVDNYIKLTSTTTCTTTATQDITSAALTVYTPNSGTLSEYFSAPNNYNTFSVTGIPPGPGHILGSYQILDLTTLSYLTAADFSVQHRTSVYASGGLTVTGAYQNGPFGSFSVVKTGKVYSIFGVANTSLVPINNGVIHSVFRLTYDPTGYYTDFNFYYIPDSV
jgi:hypothetical protein